MTRTFVIMELGEAAYAEIAAALAAADYAHAFHEMPDGRVVLGMDGIAVAARPSTRLADAPSVTVAVCVLDHVWPAKLDRWVGRPELDVPLCPTCGGHWVWAGGEAYLRQGRPGLVFRGKVGKPYANVVGVPAQPPGMEPICEMTDARIREVYQAPVAEEIIWLRSWAPQPARPPQRYVPWCSRCRKQGDHTRRRRARKGVRWRSTAWGAPGAASPSTRRRRARCQ